jgi:hypothetical protein
MPSRLQISEARATRPEIQDSRHEFDTPPKFQIPSFYDWVFWAAVPVLETYNQQSLHHQADPLLIEALSIALTLVYGCDTSSAVHCLVRHKLFIKLQMKLVCDLDRGWGAGTVMVRDNDRWIPLANFLKTLGQPTLHNWRTTLWERQYQWWKSLHKPFRFLDLPVELQKRILLFAIGEYVEPRHFCRWVPDPESGREKRVPALTVLTSGNAKVASGSDGYNHTKLPKLKPVNHGLLRLNKATRASALEVLWADTTKRYSNYSYPHLYGSYFLKEEYTDLGQLYGVCAIPTCVPARYLGFIRRIQLAYSNRLYIELFGCPIKPHIDENPAEGAEMEAALKMLPNLAYLEVRFESTAHLSYSPWDRLEDKYDTPYTIWPGINFARLPCQQTLLEWILPWIASRVMHIPRVELSGYIKTSSKRKWEGIIKAKDVATIEKKKNEIRELPFDHENLLVFAFKNVITKSLLLTPLQPPTLQLSQGLRLPQTRFYGLLSA